MAQKGISLSQIMKDFTEGLEKNANFADPSLVQDPMQEQAMQEQAMQEQAMQQQAMQQQAMQEQAMQEQAVQAETEKDAIIDKAVDAVAETSADKAKAVEELKSIAKEAAEKEQTALAKEAAEFGKVFADQFITLMKQAGVDEKLVDAKDFSTPKASVDKDLKSGKDHSSPDADVDADLEQGKDFSRPVPPETQETTEAALQVEKKAEEIANQIFDEAYELTITKVAAERAYTQVMETVSTDMEKSAELVDSAFDESYELALSGLITKEAYEVASQGIEDLGKSNETGEVYSKIAAEAYELTIDSIRG